MMMMMIMGDCGQVNHLGTICNQPLILTYYYKFLNDIISFLNNRHFSFCPATGY